MKTQQKPRTVQSKRHAITHQKVLTASLLDSHYTDGHSSWCSLESKIDLYRTKTSCIGSSRKDLGPGEPVFFDFEPFSTRLKLMCKLIIIIQGAVYERSGPPKLVQDRSVQFPERSDNLKIKSNSLEDLLEEVKLPYLPENKKNIFNSRLKRSNSRLAEKRLRNKSLTSNCLSDDESITNSYVEESLTIRYYDTEHYFKFRLSGSNKDYTSLPYYQYGSKAAFNSHKSTDTTDYKIRNQSTSTDDLIDKSTMDFFSKRQLMSSQSLFEKVSIVNNSETNFERAKSHFIPIDIEPSLARAESDLDNDIHDKRRKDNFEKSKNRIFQKSDIDGIDRILETLDENLIEKLKAGPKKSKEWSMFCKNDNDLANKKSGYDLDSKSSTTKTTRITKITTKTSSTSSSTEITKMISTK